MTPGYTTTEFWITVISVIVSGLVALFPKTFAGHAVSDAQVRSWAVAAASVASGFYALARAITKKAHITAGSSPPPH